MYLVKIFSLVAVFIICTLMGFSKSKSLENRLDSLRKLESALIMFKSKLSFTKEPLETIFSDISKVIYDDRDNIFSRCVDSRLYDFSERWKTSVDSIDIDLTKDDKDIIKIFGKLLGKTDIKGQLNEVDLAENLIKVQIQKAEDIKNKNSKMYKSLGIIMGLTICIIFI